MARFNITLPDTLKEQLKAEADIRKMKPSGLIAECVAEHYDKEPKAAYEKELENLKEQQAEAVERAQMEAEALKRQLEREQAKTAQIIDEQGDKIKELQDVLDNAKIEVAELRQGLVDKEDDLQALGQEKQDLMERAEQEIADKNEQIQKLEEGIPELLRRIEDLRTSKEAVTTGLQHELELSQTKLKSLEEQLVLHKGMIQGLEKDKESLQKQLELVTLRLPTPKEGFWSKLFRSSTRQTGE